MKLVPLTVRNNSIMRLENMIAIVFVAYCFTILMEDTTCSKVTPVDVRQFKKRTHTGTQYENASVARINLSETPKLSP